MLYADAKSKVGNVKVYRCPNCRDSKELIKFAAFAKELLYRMNPESIEENHSNETYKIYQKAMDLAAECEWLPILENVNDYKEY